MIINFYRYFRSYCATPYSSTFGLIKNDGNLIVLVKKGDDL